MAGKSGVALYRLPSMATGRTPEPPIIWAIFLVVAGAVLLVSFLYVAIISKILPPSGIYVLDALRNDWYYVLLIPVTLPTMVVAVYLHWLSMKLFKHA